MTIDSLTAPDLWTVRLNFRQTLSGSLPEKLSEALEDIAVAVFLHNEESTDGDNWTITLTTLGKPDIKEISRRVGLVASAEKLSPLLEDKDIIAERTPQRDWLQHVHENFPPIQMDRFFIYGSHYSGEKPASLMALQIDAATAFGSGEHETTKGCLQALGALKENHAFKNGLDMGCGSGILAIALAKLWPDIKVTAIDIDPESIRVTERHAAMNDTAGHIHAAAGDGYHTPLARQNAPYDIIAANILANPLIEMAPQLAAVLKPGGFAVLSGLLGRQQTEVAGAHEKLGLRLVRAEKIGEWCALIFQK